MELETIHSIVFIIVGVIATIAGLGYWYDVYKVFQWSKETGKDMALHDDAMMLSFAFIAIIPPLCPILGIIIIIVEICKII